jgi:hypothetical protein
MIQPGRAIVESNSCHSAVLRIFSFPVALTMLAMTAPEKTPLGTAQSESVVSSPWLVYLFITEREKARAYRR